MDCLVAFDANLYSVPARKVRPRQLVEIRATKSQVSLHSTVPDTGGQTLLAVHPWAVGRGARIVMRRTGTAFPPAPAAASPPATLCPRPAAARQSGPTPDRCRVC
ncbi:Mu transposase domain-containing protein [Streptomyces olivaceoviridis]